MVATAMTPDVDASPSLLDEHARSTRRPPALLSSLSASAGGAIFRPTRGAASTRALVASWTVSPRPLSRPLTRRAVSRAAGCRHRYAASFATQPALGDSVLRCKR